MGNTAPGKVPKRFPYGRRFDFAGNHFVLNEPAAPGASGCWFCIKSEYFATITLTALNGAISFRLQLGSEQKPEIWERKTCCSSWIGQKRAAVTSATR
ncbi:unnamed protein product [Victoria cruziana]